VDYHRRQRELKSLVAACNEDGASLRTFLQDLLSRIEDGRIKLYVTWRALNLRRRYPDVFSEGAYLDLKASGPRAEHICAFVRRFEDREVLAAATRWFARLAGDSEQLPLGSPTWEETWIEPPDGAHARSYRNVLTDETVQVREHADGTGFRAADLFNWFPVALLVND